MKFGTWNVRSGSLIAVARELDLLLIQEGRWDKGGMVTFSMERKRKSSTGNRIICAKE